MPVPDPKDPLQGDYVAECSGCGASIKLRLELGIRLKVGDQVYRDPNNASVGRCFRCKRYALVVTQAPEEPPPPGAKGFWKIPTE